MAEFLGRGIHHIYTQDERKFYATSVSQIPYLAFADDVLIFLRCSEECLDVLRVFFKLYEAYSGQRINT